MTELEFDILDELYFINTFEVLLEQVDAKDSLLRDTLEDLLKKGWIKCLSEPDTETPYDEKAFHENYRNYHYLATKKGLMKHNLS